MKGARTQTQDHITPRLCHLLAVAGRSKDPSIQLLPQLGCGEGQGRSQGAADVETAWGVGMSLILLLRISGTGDRAAP